MLALAGFLSFLSATQSPSYILAHIELAPQLPLSIHHKVSKQPKGHLAQM